MAISSSLPGETGDIVALRGDTFRRDIAIIRNGVPENHAGSSFRMQIKRGAVLIKELSTTDGTITIDPDTTGVLILRITAAVMHDLEVGSFVYDMQQTYADGTVLTRWRGTFSITDDITKPLS